MKKIKSITMGLLFAGSGYSTVLLSDNFETGTPGTQPVATVVSPSANTADNYVTVINSVANKAGSGQGIQFYDVSPTVGTRLEYDLSGSVSALRFDYSFSPLNTGGSGTVNYMTVGVTQAGLSSATAGNRYCEMRLYDSAQVRFYALGASIASRIVTNSAAYTASMFLNDSDATITYTDPNGVIGNTLAANTVAYWMNGEYIGSGGLSAVSAGTTAGLGRIGVASSSTIVGMNYAIDNIAVSEIVPPSAAGSVSLYLLGE